MPVTHYCACSLLTHVRVVLKTGSDTFRSLLIYQKEQESGKNILTMHENSSSLEGLMAETHFLDIEKSNSKRLFSDNSKCKIVTKG